jgi:8-amino-7-oxononanoate synthase
MSAKLEQVEQKGLLRQLTLEENKIDFASNDYLGFAQHYNIIRSEPDHSANTNGATGSRLISGNSKEAMHAEEFIAQYHGFEAALVFNSGYVANIGLCTSIAGRNDTFIVDELVHASIIDGIRLSNATKFNFKHNDILSLENKLKKAKGKIFVIVESLYSMEGDFAPLKEIIRLCEKHKAILIVDEAHAVGVWGKDGKGWISELGLENKVLACVYTYGKAFGLHGAAVTGSETLKKYLLNFARPFIFSTALPPLLYAQIHQQYQLLTNVNTKTLFDLIAYFRIKSKNLLDFKFINSGSQIQAIVLGDNQKAIALASYLNQQGFFVKAIRSPTVPLGTERVRICLHLFNTTKQIDLLFDKLKLFKP